MNFRLIFTLTLGASLNAMDYYTFTIDGVKVGYYETELKDDVHYQNAYLVMNGDNFENPFRVKCVNGAITEFKAGDDEWKTLAHYPKNAYPTCAFTFLALKLKDGESFTYNQINEGKDAVTGQATLTRNGNKISESMNGEDGRYLILNDKHDIIEFGWGGTAKSIKVKDKANAVKDTPFKE